MTFADELSWTTEPSVFAALAGGQALIDWFGFVPSFHDANLLGVDIASGSASMRIDAFRITDEVDAAGRFVFDRRATVTFELGGVTGIILAGNAQSIISELCIRRIEVAPSGFQTCGGPQVGDYEVRFESSYGLQGAIYSKDLSVRLDPRERAEGLVERE